MIAGNFMQNNDLKKGDKINITFGNVQIKLKIAGIIKDAFLGSDFMGNTRFFSIRRTMKNYPQMKIL